MKAKFWRLVFAIEHTAKHCAGKVPIGAIGGGRKRFNGIATGACYFSTSKGVDIPAL